MSKEELIKKVILSQVEDKIDAMLKIDDHLVEPLYTNLESRYIRTIACECCEKFRALAESFVPEKIIPVKLKEDMSLLTRKSESSY